MSEPRFGGSGRPFDPSEVSGVAPNSEVASDTEMARALERFAARTSVPASPEFTDRVMALIAKEPTPAPARVAGSALRHGAIGGFLVALGDAWRVVTGPGFPIAARAQAASLVLAVAVAVGGSGLVAAGAAGLLDPNEASPSPTVSPAPTPFFSPSPSTSPTPSAAPSEDPSASPSSSPEETESSEDPSASPSSSPEETESPDSSDGSDGGGESATPGSTDDTGGGDETLKPGETLNP